LLSFDFKIPSQIVCEGILIFTLPALIGEGVVLLTTLGFVAADSRGEYGYHRAAYSVFTCVPIASPVVVKILSGVTTGFSCHVSFGASDYAR